MFCGIQKSKALEEKWESVQMHTGWKLELCFKPAHDDRNGDNPSIPVTEVSTLPPLYYPHPKMTSSYPLETPPQHLTHHLPVSFLEK